MDFQAEQAKAHIKNEIRRRGFTLKEFSVRIGKSRYYLTTTIHAQSIHMGVLLLRDHLDFPQPMLDWAMQRMIERKEHSRWKGKPPTESNLHWWHGVKLYPIAAQRWAA